MTPAIEPEALFEGDDALVIDPGDYYALPEPAQAILDALLLALELDKDHVTMFAWRGAYMGVWWHTKDGETEHLRIVSGLSRVIDVELGPMDRGER